MGRDNSTWLLPHVETKNWERQSQKVRKRQKESLPEQRKEVRKWAATGATLPPWPHWYCGLACDSACLADSGPGVCECACVCASVCMRVCVCVCVHTGMW